MGGYGSGGWNLKHAGTVASRRRLDACKLVRRGVLKPGIIATVSWGEGEGKSSVLVHGGVDDMRLQYSWRRGEAPWKPHEERVALAHSPRHHGGVQTYFRCPKCARRVRYLYNGGIRYLCRHCLDLVYASSRERPGDRAMRRVNKLRQRIGADIGLEAAIRARPKGMHRATFDRILHEIVSAEEEVWAGAMRRFGKLAGQDFGWRS